MHRLLGRRERAHSASAAPTSRSGGPTASSPVSPSSAKSPTSPTSPTPMLPKSPKPGSRTGSPTKRSAGVLFSFVTSKITSTLHLRGSSSGANNTNAGSDSTPASPNPQRTTRTAAQTTMIAKLATSTGCDPLVADQALEACLWDMEAATLLQAKLVEANKMLETEQKELLEQECDLYVSKFNEALEIQRKMEEMQRVLDEEEEELRRQQRMVEIDRREAELYPEEEAKKDDEAMGDDAFTREMKERGLKHVRKGGSEEYITADMLPPELDLDATLASLPECPMPDPEPEAGADTPEDEQVTTTTTTEAPATDQPQPEAEAETHNEEAPVTADRDDTSSTEGRNKPPTLHRTPLAQRVEAAAAPPQLQESPRRRSTVVVALDGIGIRKGSSEPDLAQLAALHQDAAAGAVAAAGEEDLANDAEGTRDKEKGASRGLFSALLGTSKVPAKSMQDVSFAF
eukprot:m.90289 g.90289  ORF g.90289 m.90289 type:complete len:458 (+) comp9848_c1_seq1:66-1439(+)